MDRMKKCKGREADLNLGGCAYGSVRLCCKDCILKPKCNYVCGKSYEIGVCRYEIGVEEND